MRRVFFLSPFVHSYLGLGQSPSTPFACQTPQNADTLPCLDIRENMGMGARPIALTLSSTPNSTFLTPWEECIYSLTLFFSFVFLETFLLLLKTNPFLVLESNLGYNFI